MPMVAQWALAMPPGKPHRLAYVYRNTVWHSINQILLTKGALHLNTGIIRFHDAPAELSPYRLSGLQVAFGHFWLWRRSSLKLPRCWVTQITARTLNIVGRTCGWRTYSPLFLTFFKSTRLPMQMASNQGSQLFCFCLLTSIPSSSLRHYGMRGIAPHFKIIGCVLPSGWCCQQKPSLWISIHLSTGFGLPIITTYVSLSARFLALFASRPCQISDL